MIEPLRFNKDETIKRFVSYNYNHMKLNVLLTISCCTFVKHRSTFVYNV